MSEQRGYRVFEWVGRRARVVTVGSVLIAVALVTVGGFAADRGEPSFSPGGEIYDIEDRANTVFSSTSPIITAAYLVEHPDGADMLSRDALLTFKTRADIMQARSENAAHLSTSFDTDQQVEVDGVFSIADAVDAQLPSGLEGASNVDVKVALSDLLADDAPTAGLRFTLSQLTSRDVIEVGGQPVVLWQAPAFIASVVYDVDTFDRGQDLESFGEPVNLDAERWLRDVQGELRGTAEGVTVIGVAIDPGLTGEEISETSGPFIFGAVAFILILVGALLRSYWAAMVAGAGLSIVMMSYNGVNSLIGLKTGSPLLILIVPIALISFGIDFFVHGSGRVREMQVEGHTRERAYPLGATALFTALLLAVLSSVAAFLSNAASGIEAIIEFGIASAVALAFSYLFLGLIAPKVLVSIEEALGPRPDLHRSLSVGLKLVGHKIGFVFASLFAGVTVTLAIVLPAGFEAGGAAASVLFLVFVLLFLYLPFRLTRRRNRRAAERGADLTDEVKGAGHGFAAAGSIVHFLARWRVVTIPLVVVLAVAGVIGALKVESKFELSDFFSKRTDFIKSLDRLDVHFASQSGGPGFIYVEGDLTSPATLRALDDAVADLAASDAQLGTDFDGNLIVTNNASSLVRAAAASTAMQSSIGGDFGDSDVDGLPDSRETIRQIYEYAAASGVMNDDGTVVFRPDQVASFLYVDGATQATRVEVIVSSVVEDDIILEARSALDAAAASLEGSLAGEQIDTVSVSGAVITQQDTLASFTDAMLISLPLAIALTVLIVGLVLRSIRYALISMVPILLVVAWLYGFMFVADYSINVITATIAAIAIGVGIDFSTHFTVRFREEFAGEPSRFPALRRAGEGTGGALAISAVTSITGFLVMSLAPTPMFQTFGVLTAMMILFALLVSLLVLPSLLLLVTPSRKGEERARLEAAVTGGRFDYEPHARSTAERRPDDED